MKITRRQLKRLIESIIDDESSNIVPSSRPDLDTDNIFPLVHNLYKGNWVTAEQILQGLGTDDVTLNKIDYVYRKRYLDFDNDPIIKSAGVLIYKRIRGFDRTEVGISSLIFETLAHHKKIKTQPLDYLPNKDTHPVPEEYVHDVQSFLRDYPGLLALFNANK